MTRAAFSVIYFSLFRLSPIVPKCIHHSPPSVPERLAVVDSVVVASVVVAGVVVVATINTGTHRMWHIVTELFHNAEYTVTNSFKCFLIDIKR